MERYCKECKWFDLDVFEEGDHSSWCQRFPPVYVGPPIAGWMDDCDLGTIFWEKPLVGIRGTCGEWAPRETGRDGTEENMNEIKLTIRTFRMDDDKGAAVKVLEEAAEAYNAWDIYWDSIAPTDGETEPCPEQIVKYERERFEDEMADVIQATCNLAARYGIDLSAAMERCRQRNLSRGRYDANEGE